MNESDIRDQITELEDHIEALTESIERCRKIAVGAKICVAMGAAWFVLVLFWILPFDATAFVAALTAVLGGIVLLGSNSTTWAQTEADRDVAEMARADLIERIDLRVVGDRTSTIH
jgi:hypothetical protein